MRASTLIVEGVFCGAEIEPGTFHSDSTRGRRLAPSPPPHLTAQPDRTVSDGQRLAAVKRDAVAAAGMAGRGSAAAIRFA